MQVLIIDGPARGTIREMNSSKFVALNGPFQGQPVYYYVHFCYLLGRIVRIASVHQIMECVDLEDVFDVMTSQLAKEAALPRQRRDWKEVIENAIR